MSELVWTILLLAIGITMFIFSLYTMRYWPVRGFLLLATSTMTILLSTALDEGNGIYARVFYSKEVRTAWQARVAHKDMIMSGTYTYKVRIACPDKKKWSTWDEATKSEWRTKYSGYVISLENCE